MGFTSRQGAYAVMALDVHVSVTTSSCSGTLTFSYWPTFVYTEALLDQQM